MNLQDFIAKHSQAPPSIGRVDILEDFIKSTVAIPGYLGIDWASDVIEYYRDPQAFHNLCVYLHGPRLPDEWAKRHEKVCELARSTVLPPRKPKEPAKVIHCITVSDDYSESGFCDVVVLEGPDINLTEEKLAFDLKLQEGIEPVPNHLEDYGYDAKRWSSGPYKTADEEADRQKASAKMQKAHLKWAEQIKQRLVETAETLKQTLAKEQIAETARGLFVAHLIQNKGFSKLKPCNYFSI